MTRLNSQLVEIKCDYCSAAYRIHFTEDQERRWKRGQIIEHVAPSLSPSERELIMGGVCQKCWDALEAKSVAS